MKSTLKILLPLAVVALGVVASVVLVKAAPEAETVEPTVVPRLVRVVEAVPETVRLDVTTQGTVSPRTEADLVAQVGGLIVDVAPSFAAGGSFRRGELLVRIDPTDYRLAVAQAEAAVAQAETALSLAEAEARAAREEWEELSSSAGVSDRPAQPNPLVLREPQLAEARANLESARARLERAEVDLQRTRVVAPFDGRVRQKLADVGQSVTPGARLGQVFATDSAEVRLPVPISELRFLEVDLTQPMADGPAVELTADLAGERRSWPARLVRSAGEIDPATRMLGLIARVDRPYAPREEAGGVPLTMGLFVDATIAGRREEGLIVLPRGALREGPAGAASEDPATGWVLTVERGTETAASGAADDGEYDRLRFRRVEVLREVGDRAVVSGGLEAGDLVAISPIDTPVDGMAVRVAEERGALGSDQSTTEPGEDATAEVRP